MDKLTVEEKAKRYDEAFGIARNVWRFSSNNAEIMRMEELFPELKESEDEEVRKIILDQMKCWNEDAIQKNCEIDIEASSKCIAWLEKQGEQKPAEWNVYNENIEEYNLNIVLKLMNYESK